MGKGPVEGTRRRGLGVLVYGVKSVLKGWVFWVALCGQSEMDPGLRTGDSGV